MTVEKHTKKMYDQFGKEYQRTREEKHKSRLYNKFLEVPCMIKAVGNIKDKKLLDVGCGAGVHIRKYLSKGAKCWGIDLSETMINLAKKRCRSVDFKVGTITKLPYNKSSFDIVTASLIIDYVGNLKKAFSEVNRVLKRKGLFYYSDISPISMAKENYEDKDIIANGIGHIINKKTNKHINLGTNWEEKITEFEMVPGMTIKAYKRMFRTNLKALNNAGFELIDFIDCKPTSTFKKHDPIAYETFIKFPLFSIYVARKK